MFSSPVTLLFLEAGLATLQLSFDDEFTLYCNSSQPHQSNFYGPVIRLW